ncbi:MAG: hypothetical protein NTW94_03370 [Legionellales bacterium]|nr:hypothetical protein [Legionellales bacterium]
MPILMTNVKRLPKAGGYLLELSLPKKMINQSRQWWRDGVKERKDLAKRLTAIETEKRELLRSSLPRTANVEAKLKDLTLEETKKFRRLFFISSVMETVELAYTAGLKYPLRFFSLDVSPIWSTPIKMSIDTVQQTTAFAQTISQLVLAQKWALREQPIEDISSSAQKIIDSLNNILSSFSESVVKRGIDVDAIENRRIRLFLAHPPRIESSFLSSKDFKSLLRILGGSATVAHNIWQLATGNAIFQQMTKAGKSLEIMDESGLLPFTGGKELISKARSLHESPWLQTGVKYTFLLNTAVNLIDIMPSFYKLYKNPQVVKSSIQTAIMSSFSGAPWPSSSLSNRHAAYQSVMDLLGTNASLTTLETMITHMMYNLCLHAASVAGSKAGEPITKLMYFLYKTNQGHQTLDYYPDFRNLPVVSWIPEVSIYANPAADETLRYFMNKLLMETVITPVAGAFIQGLSVAFIRHHIQKVIDSPAFIHALRETIDGFLRSFLFNPDELMEFELRRPESLLAPSEQEKPGFKNLEATILLLETLVSGLCLKSSPEPTTSLVQQFERSLLSVPGRLVTKLKHHPPAKFETHPDADPMRYMRSSIDRLLEKTPMPSHGKKHRSWAELPGSVVVTSLSYLTGLFVSTERLLNKRILEAQSDVELPTNEELDEFEQQCKNRLCCAYRATARVAQMRIACEKKTLALALTQERTRRGTLRLYSEHKELLIKINTARSDADLPTEEACLDTKTKLSDLKESSGLNAKGLGYIRLIEKIFSTDLNEKRQLKLDELTQDWTINLVASITEENISQHGNRQVCDMLASCPVKQHPLFEKMVTELRTVLEKHADDAIQLVGSLPEHANTLNDISVVIEEQNFEKMTTKMIESLNTILRDLNGQEQQESFVKYAVDGLKRKTNLLLMGATELIELHDDILRKLRNMHATLPTSLEAGTANTLKGALVTLSDILNKAEKTPGIYPVIARELGLPGETHDQASIMVALSTKNIEELKNFLHTQYIRLIQKINLSAVQFKRRSEFNWIDHVDSFMERMSLKKEEMAEYFQSFPEPHKLLLSQTNISFSDVFQSFPRDLLHQLDGYDLTADIEKLLTESSAISDSMSTVPPVQELNYSLVASLLRKLQVIKSMAQVPDLKSGLQKYIETVNATTNLLVTRFNDQRIGWVRLQMEAEFAKPWKWTLRRPSDTFQKELLRRSHTLIEHLHEKHFFEPMPLTRNNLAEEIRKTCDGQLEINFFRIVEERMNYLKTKSRIHSSRDTSEATFEEQKRVFLFDLAQLPFESVLAEATKTRISDQINSMTLLDLAPRSETPVTRK